MDHVKDPWYISQNSRIKCSFVIYGYSLAQLQLLFQFPWCGVRYYLSFLDERYALAELLSFLHIMSGENYGDILFIVYFFNEPPYLYRHVRVKTDRGLIQKKQAGLVDQCFGERKPLLYAC